MDSILAGMGGRLMNNGRIGIYGSIPKNYRENKIITRILGYDPFSVQEVPQDEIIAPFSGRAHKFGIHFTICDLFTPTDYEGVIQKLRECLRHIHQIEYTFSSFQGYVRGDYQGKSIYAEKTATVLGLELDDAGISSLQKIHKVLLPAVQTFRATIEPEFNKPLFKSRPDLWELIAAYGAPYVMENYRPHLTLASGFDGSNRSVEEFIPYLNAAYGQELLNSKIPFDRVYIFQEITDGKYKGFFQVKDELKLAE
jgi:hypothetical protein